MSEKFQLKGCIYEPCSDIPLNWSDMRSVFGMLYEIWKRQNYLRN
jgi:hypothetical protein